MEQPQATTEFIRAVAFISTVMGEVTTNMDRTDHPDQADNLRVFWGNEDCVMLQLRMDGSMLLQIHSNGLEIEDADEYPLIGYATVHSIEVVHD